MERSAPRGVRTRCGTLHRRPGLAAVASVMPLIVGVTLGLILLAASAARAGWVRGWVVGVAVLALLADFSPTSWNTVIFAALASVVVGAVTAGLRRPLD